MGPLFAGHGTFGEDLGWGSSVLDSAAIISRYLDDGGNFIDTAQQLWKESERLTRVNFPILSDAGSP